MTTTQGEHAQVAALTPAQQTESMPPWMQYDERQGVLTIHGKRYAAAMFGETGFLAPIGTLLRVEAGEPDCVTLHVIAPAQPAQGAAYAELPDLFREALAWGMTYGPEIPAHQWEEMRESMVKQYTERASHGQAPAIQQAGSCVYHIAEPCPYRGLCVHCQPTPTAQAAPAATIPNAALADLHEGLAAKLHDGPARNLHLETAAALRAPAAGAVAGPGWKLVPVVVTNEMWQAYKRPSGKSGDWSFAQRYTAMLAAAPTPAAQADSQPAPMIGASTHQQVFDALEDAHELGGPPHERIRQLIEQRDSASRAARAPADSVLEDAAPSKCSINRYCHANMCLETDADHETDCPQGHAARKEGGV